MGRDDATGRQGGSAAVEAVKLRFLDVATDFVFYVGLPALFLGFALQLPTAGRTAWGLIYVLGSTSGPMLLFAMRRAPTRARAIAFLAYATTMATFGLVIYGPLVGLGPIYAIAMVLGVAYFGGRGLVWVVILVLLAMGAVGAGFASGLITLAAPEYMDPTRGVNLVRMGFTVLVTSAFLGFLLLFLVRGLEATAQRLGVAIEGEATDRLARERAQAAILRAQRLETIGRLAGGVAHDFNNALVVILGTAQLLRGSGALGPRELRLAEAIEDAAWRASGVSRQLLTFTRRDVSRVEDVEVDAVVEHVAQVLERLTPDDVEVRTEVGSGARVRMDRGRLEQALLNLGINAHDALPTGGTLVFASRNEGDGVVVLEVRDSGQGMDPATLARVFDPDAPAEMSDEGTGLGLPVARDIAREAGGRLEGHSVPGEGTTARLLLPTVAPSPARASQAPVARTSAPARVLLVEPSPEVQTLVARVLARQGYTVDAVATATEAHARLDEEASYDLLLVETDLPDASPLPLVARFDLDHPASPILLCGGTVSDEELLGFVEAGRASYLAKPFSPDDLTREVTELFELFGLGGEP